MLVSPLRNFLAIRFERGLTSCLLKRVVLRCDVVVPKVSTLVRPDYTEEFYIDPDLYGRFNHGFSFVQLVVPRSFYDGVFTSKRPQCGDWFLDYDELPHFRLEDYLSTWRTDTETFDFGSGDDFFDTEFFAGNNANCYAYRLNSWSFDDDFFYCNLLKHPVANRSLYLHGKDPGNRPVLFDTNRPLVKVKNRIF